jgi:two-component system, NarL family, response regulator
LKSQYPPGWRMPVSDKRIRILTVDDHPLLRDGIAALIEGQPDMELVGEAANGLEAIECYSKYRPDIILMDLQMPRMGGIDAMIAIRDRWPDAKVIVLTTYVGDVLAQRALRAGARAYVLKVLVRKELLDTIRAVHSGSKRVHPEVAADIASHVGSDVLSHREIDVLTAIAAGKSNKTVASTLGIAEETVKMHVKAILAKLGANDRTHAVTLAIRRGIIQL